MKLNTASSAISFTRTLEDDSAKLYEELAEKYPNGRETFLSWIKENQRHKVSVDRAYYGVISDALEGAFSFEGIDTDDYSVEPRLPEGSTPADALNAAIVAEEKIVEFYRTAAEVSRSLMADVPRALARVARKRSGRIAKLRSFLQASGFSIEELKKPT